MEVATRRLLMVRCPGCNALLDRTPFEWRRFGQVIVPICDDCYADGSSEWRVSAAVAIENWLAMDRELAALRGEPGG